MSDKPALLLRDRSSGGDDVRRDEEYDLVALPRTLAVLEDLSEHRHVRESGNLRDGLRVDVPEKPAQNSEDVRDRRPMMAL